MMSAGVLNPGKSEAVACKRSYHRLGVVRDTQYSCVRPPPYVDLPVSDSKLHRLDHSYFHVGVTPDANDYRVILDNEPLTTCVCADAIEGWAEVLMPWPICGSSRCGDSYLIRLFGKVRIIKTCLG